MPPVFQTLGGAFSVSAAQSAFVNTMITTLATTAPNIDPSEVIATGATQIRTAFPSDQIHGIILAYMAGIRSTFAISVGTVGFAFVLSCFCSWKRLHGGAFKDVAAFA